MTKHTDEIFKIIEEVVTCGYSPDHAGDDEISEAVAKIETLTAPRKYDRHEEIKLIELEGELIELAVRYEGGHAEACGRVRLVHGGAGVDTVLWVNRICVPCDAVVYLESIGKRWVFESKRHNAPNAPKPSHVIHTVVDEMKPPTPIDAGGPQGNAGGWSEPEQSDLFAAARAKIIAQHTDEAVRLSQEPDVREPLPPKRDLPQRFWTPGAKELARKQLAEHEADDAIDFAVAQQSKTTRELLAKREAEERCEAEAANAAKSGEEIADSIIAEVTDVVGGPHGEGHYTADEVIGVTRDAVDDAFDAISKAVINAVSKDTRRRLPYNELPENHVSGEAGHLGLLRPDHDIEGRR